MRTIVFIGSNKSGSSREAIRAAERLGFFTVLLTDRRTFVNQRLEFPDVHRMIHCDSLYDLDELAKKIDVLKEQGKVVEAIVSFLEAHSQTAAKMAERYDLRHVSLDAILRMSDKIQTRETLKDTPYCPYYTVYDGTGKLTDFIDENTSQLPLVVKSPQSTGSKDVLKANTSDELLTHLTKLRDKYPDQPVLVEEYLDGPQYLVEVLVDDRGIHLVAVIEQEIMKKRRFIVIGYTVLAEMPASLKSSLTEAVSDIVKKMELEKGACHLELRLVHGEWKLIEINPRISGGAMNRMIEVATGINLVQETIRLMVGERPRLKRESNHYVYTHYLTVRETGYLERVTGKKRAARIDGVREVFVKPRKGQKLYVPESMGHRYAYIIAIGETKEEAKSAAKRAGDEIKFTLTRRWNG
ncbi:biotin carboxylase [Tumebacillus avium]|uniref:Biotin carboxylase n=1 Tax=Tumebacillus avium TaxID=1903704 RepID=A0A1Y0INY3_9BACL|nr:ATP-grasp domain-containing protein [Tumebacillus avium]ARU61970.1 biotin carboxylase [Tumebacillus avium]